jgi:hypothetical protein
MDNRQKLATAHVLHSQAILADAPASVLRAMSEWIQELTKAGRGNVEDVAVADACSVSMVSKKTDA